MLFKLPFILLVAALSFNDIVCGPVNVLFESNGQSLKLGEIKLGELQEVRVQESSALCNYGSKGLLRMRELHLEFCDGKSWVRLLDDTVGRLVPNSPEKPVDCLSIKKQGKSEGDGMYWLDPDGGSHSNAFLAYCDMTSYNGGWTMCYTTDDKAKPKTEVIYRADFPYGSDGYRTNCNNIAFSEIMFVDHQTGKKVYFKRRRKTPLVTAANNYGYAAQALDFGYWDRVDTNNAYVYQLLICDTPFYTGFFVSGYTDKCFKQCSDWCGDTASPYFRTASSDANYKGVAFDANGHQPNIPGNRLISVGLR